jgi:hypothetical protein
VKRAAGTGFSPPRSFLAHAFFASRHSHIATSFSQYGFTNREREVLRKGALAPLCSCHSKTLHTSFGFIKPPKVVNDRGRAYRSHGCWEKDCRRFRRLLK